MKTNKLTIIIAAMLATFLTLGGAVSANAQSN